MYDVPDDDAEAAASVVEVVGYGGAVAVAAVVDLGGRSLLRIGSLVDGRIPEGSLREGRVCPTHSVSSISKCLE